MTDIEPWNPPQPISPRALGQAALGPRLASAASTGNEEAGPYLDDSDHLRPATPATPTRPRQQTERRPRIIVWSVVFALAAQVAVGAAGMVGGDPVIGIATSVAMSVCSIALVSAQTMAEMGRSQPRRLQRRPRPNPNGPTSPEADGND